MSSGSRKFDSHVEIVDYYDSRFQSNYMEKWDNYVEMKIRLFFKQFESPPGLWLDFGCGQGSLTELLLDIHPQYKVEGSDISSVAIQRALARNPNLSFFVWDECPSTQKYDLIFSHHVLEHVLNLEETLDHLDKITDKGGLHCHILPCGNKGSLEWKVAKNTQAGFEDNGRYFFEEDGHLRRLTSQQLIDLYAKRNYRLVISQFANHYYGALKWLTDLGPSFISDFANPRRGKSLLSSIWLCLLQFHLLLLWRARSFNGLHQPRAQWKKIIYLFLLPLAKGYTKFFFKNLEIESTNRLSDSRGSEMLICFIKE